MSPKPTKKTNTNKPAGNVYKAPAEKKPTGRWMLIPAAIMFGYVPLIMRTYQYDPMLSQFEWFDEGQVVDVYMACKMYVILVLGFVMLGMFFLYRLIQGEKFKLNKIMIPLYVYFGGVLISGILSKYKYYAWGGSFEMFESVPVVLIYVFTTIYVFRQMRDMEDFTYFWHIAAPGVLIESLICTYQMWGKDFIDTHFAKYLYLSPPYWPQMDTMTTGMGGAAYGTLYNPDFLPMYFAAAIPVAAAAFFGVKKPADAASLALSGKNEKWEMRRYTLERIFDGIVLGFTLLGLYGSKRVTGTFVFIAIGFIMIIGDQIFEKKQMVLLVAAGVVLVAAVIGLSFTNTSVGERLKSVWTADYNPQKDIFIENLYNMPNEVEFVVDYKGTDYVYHASMEVIEGSYENPDTGETVITHTPEVSLSCENMDGIAITPSDETKVSWSSTRADDPAYAITVTGYYVDPAYDEEGNMTAEAYWGLTVYGINQSFGFDKTEEGYKYRNHRGLDIDFPNDVEYDRVFSEDFFHGRGHIYNYSIPQLKRSIIFGSGSNTFVLVYPQNDYLTETYHSLDVKPHCFYIQQWIENGLVATLALVVFLMWLAISLIQLLVAPTEDKDWKKGGFYRGLPLASIALIAGVMVAWLTNDSNICSAPIVWPAFGLALFCYQKGQTMIGKEGN